MSKEEILELQTKMKEMGFYNGSIDGLWGPKSEAAYKEYSVSNEGNINLSIAWSAKVSTDFVKRVVKLANDLLMDSNGSDYLMSCMAWESGETFSPSIKNGAGSGATGLIQAMGFVALAYYYTRKQIDKMSEEEKKIKAKESLDKLAAMTAVEQLEFVSSYFMPYKGKIKTLSDVYMVILYPAAVGKPGDFKLFQKGGISYRQNIGLDINKDGGVTKDECTAKVYEKYVKGMLPKNRRVI
jgi:hypothetical protein